MRASVLFAIVAASYVSAQASITDLPNCALECLTTADFDGCAMDDQACLCRSEKFTTSSTACVRQNCSAEDDAKAAEVSNQLCQQAGVTVTFTPTASVTGGASSTAPATTTGTGASSASQSSVSHSSVASTSSTASAAGATNTNAASANVAGQGVLFAGLVAAAAMAL